MTIGFIGAGKVGNSLGSYLLEANSTKIMGYFSRSQDSARQAAENTQSSVFLDPKELIRASDIIFLTVPDDAIAKVALELSCGGAPLDLKIFCHSSGSQSSEILEPLMQKGARGASLHPLMAIPDKNSSKLLQKAIFTLEGTRDATGPILELLRPLGNKVFPIKKEHKTLYHCAASFVSNFSVALAQVGLEMFEACELREAAQGLYELMLLNASNILHLGPEKALTGPVERGDTGTIEAHLSVLEGKTLQIYNLLASKLLEIASRKHPTRDYTPLARLLEKN